MGLPAAVSNVMQKSLPRPNIFFQGANSPKTAESVYLTIINSDSPVRDLDFVFFPIILVTRSTAIVAIDRENRYEKLYVKPVEVITPACAYYIILKTFN